jgi:hypothetical protein
MRKITIVFSLLFLVQTAFSQTDKKEIDITTAVMEQYRSLAPKTISGFHWLPNQRFIHSGENDDLLVRNMDGDTLHHLQLSAINEGLNESNSDTLRRLRIAEVADGKVFHESRWIGIAASIDLSRKCGKYHVSSFGSFRFLYGWPQCFLQVFGFTRKASNHAFHRV